MIYFTVFTVLGSGGGGGGGLVGNNTLQLKFSSICFYCIISSKPWGGGGKLFRERVYNIFIYTQLFRVKNFSSICLYCIILDFPAGYFAVVGCGGGGGLAGGPGPGEKMVVQQTLNLY
jgi:hypothetical protein